MSFDLERAVGGLLVLDEFRSTMEILYLFVNSPQNALSLNEIQSATHRGRVEIVQVCTSLADTGLVAACGTTQNVWHLLPSSSSLTLEDVYNCVEMQFKRGLASSSSKNISAAQPKPSAMTEINTLMIEVLFNTHQLLRKYFREVYLIRLRPAAPSTFLPQFAFVKKEHKLRDLTERDPTKRGVSSH